MITSVTQCEVEYPPGCSVSEGDPPLILTGHSVELWVWMSAFTMLHYVGLLGGGGTELPTPHTLDAPAPRKLEHSNGSVSIRAGHKHWVIWRK